MFLGDFAQLVTYNPGRAAVQLVASETPPMCPLHACFPGGT